jgi:hypothetical protein
LSEADYAELKGVMRVFRKPWVVLTAEQQMSLLLLFSYAPVLQQVYALMEVLTGILNGPLTKIQAISELNNWIMRTQELGLSCFDSFMGALQKWMDDISNYFIKRDSSGFVEGLNNKIKVIKRRCYGIYGLGRLFRHIWLDIEGRRLFGHAYTISCGYPTKSGRAEYIAKHKLIDPALVAWLNEIYISVTPA